MTLDKIFSIIGGLGFFLFGLNLLTESLKKISASSIKKMLQKATSIPILGLLLGTAMTAIIQSSSATTVLTVGFVNAGLMTLKQAVGIILGANIGTTVTGQFLAQFMAFKIIQYSLPLLFVGIIIYIFSKKDSIKNAGALITGFSLIFYGMFLMSAGVAPLKDSPAVFDIFQHTF